MSGGRPSAYKAEYEKQAYQLCLLGYTDKNLADFFGVAESTINNWKLEHPEFMESLKEGKAQSDVEVEQSLREKAVGGDTTAQIFWLKNRQPRRWRDRQEIEQTNHHNYVISDEPMSEEEFRKQHGIDSVEAATGPSEDTR